MLGAKVDNRGLFVDVVAVLVVVLMGEPSGCWWWKMPRQPISVADSARFRSRDQDYYQCYGGQFLHDG